MLFILLAKNRDSSLIVSGEKTNFANLSQLHPISGKNGLLMSYNDGKRLHFRYLRLPIGYVNGDYYSAGTYIN
jgi:hypothetical protein